MFRRSLHLSNYSIYFIFVFSCFIVMINALLQCYGDNNLRRIQNKTCQWWPFQPLCLVCTVSKESDVEWFMDESIIANGPLYLGDMDGISVNTCHRENSSLLLETCAESQMIATIRCEKRRMVLMEFEVQCLLKGVLKVTVDGLEIDKISLSIYDIANKSLRCLIYDVLPPLTMEWHDNDNVIATREIIDNSTRRANFSIAISLYKSKPTTSLTCMVYGKYIENTSYTISVAEDITYEGNRGAVIGAIITGTCFFVIFAVYIFMRCVNFSRKLRDAKIMEENVCYVGLDEKYGQHSGTMPTTLLSAVSANMKPVLSREVKKSLPYDYWNAYVTTVNGGEISCLAKKLSEDATTADFTFLEALAKSYSALETNKSFVKIVHISLQTIPFAIYYEELSFGTLQHYVKDKYGKGFLSDAIIKQPHKTKSPMVNELLTIAVDVSQAMNFLHSKKFAHPGLSLRKVLLAANGSCKLYDIYPINLCMTRIKKLLQKENPPIPWMAAEIFLLNNYFPQSETWNLSVFLWELLTVGQQPFKGLHPEDVKLKVVTTFILPKPHICPKEIYQVMVSSWKKDHVIRPSLDDVLETLMFRQQNYQGVTYSEVPE